MFVFTKLYKFKHHLTNMVLTILIILFVLSSLSYILYNSYSFQILIRYLLRKKSLISLTSKTSGNFIKSGYFSSNFNFISNSEFKKLLKRQKVELHKCYSVITFKTVDANWELLFTLTKDSGKYIENIYLKCYPHTIKIQSKVAVEKIHSNLEVYSTNHSLMQILNSPASMSSLKSLLTINEETLNIGARYIQFKGVIELKDISTTILLHKISHIDNLKKKIYVPGLKSY